MKRVQRFLLLLLALLLFTSAAQAAGNQFHFDSSANAVFEGETLQLLLVRAGDCAEDGTLTYTSSRPSIATVDESGAVTGVGKGQATITAELVTAKRSWRTTLTVTVKRKVTSLQVKEENLTLAAPTDSLVADLLAPADAETAALPVLLLRVGASQSIQATLEPRDANDRAFILTTSDANVVAAQSSQFRPKAAGECVVTVQSRQNPEVFTAYRALVLQPITRLTLSAPEKFTYIGGTLALSVAYAPANASIQAVTWSSQNAKVATVDESGVVTGVAKGQTTIRATAADGSKRTANFTVTVRQQPTGLTLNTAAVQVNVNGTATLRATVQPNTANDKSVVWSSSDASVAKVSTSGRVTGVGAGTCQITCASKDFPSVSATAEVTVIQPVTSVRFLKDNVSLSAGGSGATVFWEVSPANATNPAVTFTSSNPSVATVDANGLIYGLKRGTATITVTAADGSRKRDTLKVTVHQPVTGVHMKNAQLTVGVNESVRAEAVLEPDGADNTAMCWTSEDESIATVRGENNRPSVTGKRWGATSIIGVTADGGYVVTATVNVGNPDKALVITDLYVTGDDIRINVQNQSNLVITRFTYDIEVYGMDGQPLLCNTNGSNSFTGSYGYTLYEGDLTTHGRFYFADYIKPIGIGRVVMRLTGYETADGARHVIRDSHQISVEYLAPGYAYTWDGGNG